MEMFKVESLELLASRRPRLRPREQLRELPDADPERKSALPGDDPDPDDSGPRLSVRVAQPNVEKIYPLPALPAPLPTELPSSFWTPLLFGKPDDAISPQDARLCLALIDARLSEGKDSGCLSKRDPGANAEVVSRLPMTIGALHDQIYELYDSRGWRVFQQLYHEAAGLHPRGKMAGSMDTVDSHHSTIGDATPAAVVDCSAIEPGLANAIMQAPTRVQRWMLAPPYEPPPWRRQETLAQREHREHLESLGGWTG